MNVMLTGLVVIAMSLIYAAAARTFGEQNLSTAIYASLMLALVAFHYIDRRHREGR